MVAVTTTIRDGQEWLMQRDTATAVVGQLTAWGIEAATISRGQHRAGVRVCLPDGREARWGIAGSATLEAVVLRDGVLVGFVPALPGSADFTPATAAWAIAKTDYHRPEPPTPAPRRLRPPPTALAWAGERRGPRPRRWLSRWEMLLPRTR